MKDFLTNLTVFIKQSKYFRLEQKFNARKFGKLCLDQM